MKYTIQQNERLAMLSAIYSTRSYLLFWIVLLSLFFFETSLAQPGHFDLKSPSNSSQDVDVWPLLQWNAATNAKKYILDISSSTQFAPEQTVSYDCGNTLSYKPSVDLIMNTVYYWRVTAIDSLGLMQLNNPDPIFGNYFWIFQTIPPAVDRVVLSAAPLDYDRTIIPQNTPYHQKQGNLTVQTGKSFTLLAGTTLYVDGYYSIEINGTFRALGNKDSIVKILPNGVAPTKGSWIGIRYSAQAKPTKYDASDNYLSGSIVKYSEIAYSDEWAIKYQRDSLIVRNTYIHDCNGGLYLKGNNRIIDNVFVGLTSSASGGAIYCYGNANKILHDSIRNVSASTGGSIYCNGNRNILSDLWIEGSSSLNQGGAIYSTGTGILMSKLWIDNSISNQSGGAIYINGDSSTIRSSSVQRAKIVSSINADGGGIYLSGSNSLLDSVDVFGCLDSLNSSESTSARIANGGGIFITGNNNTVINSSFRDNKVTGCPNSYWVFAYGGGIYLTGNLAILDNIIVENNIAGSSLAGVNSRGGGIASLVTSLSVQNSIILHNETKGYAGGGMFIDGWGSTIKGTTISKNISGSCGGGIMIDASNVSILQCTITGNKTYSEGAGVYGGRWIRNSIITYNTSTDINASGGIYGDPEIVSYCNLNKNSGYQLKKASTGSPSSTNSTNNWWYTRSDIVKIAGDIWDGNDTGGALGFAAYQPFLTDASDSTAGNFKVVQTIQPMLDRSYSQQLNKAVNRGDTLYVKVAGIDSNKFGINVTVLSVMNKRTFQVIRPFFEETSDSSGVFQCKVYLTDVTRLPDSIAVSPGDTLIVVSEADPSKRFSIVIGVPYIPTFVEESSTFPIAFELAQNYPNPFNPLTKIKFSVPSQTKIILRVFNILGQQVAMLVNGLMSAGNHEVTFDASSLASGVYLYQISAGNLSIVKKMLLMK
jgi:hypothetical protein